LLCTDTLFKLYDAILTSYPGLLPVFRTHILAYVTI
jgi:hypothetical protein